VFIYTSSPLYSVAESLLFAKCRNGSKGKCGAGTARSLENASSSGSSSQLSLSLPHALVPPPDLLSLQHIFSLSLSGGDSESSAPAAGVAATADHGRGGGAPPGSSPLPSRIATFSAAGDDAVGGVAAGVPMFLSAHGQGADLPLSPSAEGACATASTSATLLAPTALSARSLAIVHTQAVLPHPGTRVGISNDDYPLCADAGHAEEMSSEASDSKHSLDDSSSFYTPSPSASSESD
jgi:hypothetical protein